MQPLYLPPSIATGIEALRKRWPEVSSPSDEEPIFILAAGWRSGSTLLQRMLMPQVFMWGEPFGHAGLIEGLARPLAAFSDTWPPDDFFYAGQSPNALAKEFIANLYPEPQSLLESHLACFDRLFAQPARRAATQAVGGNGAVAVRWGVKEVRLSADHAAHLRWLYPRAKLIFLVRNPWDAYRSYAARAQEGAQWYARWPDQPLTPAFFAQHWRTLAVGFAEHAQRLGALLVQYETLSRGEYAAVEQYLGFELHRAAAEVNPEASGPQPLETIGQQELEILETQLGSVPEQFGYKPPKTRVRSIDAAGSEVPREKCAILVPASSTVEPRCEAALHVLESRGYAVRRMHGSSQIDLARSQMASGALRDGFEETLWIDSDIVFDPDAVDRLRSHALPIVCGIYPKKGTQALSCHAMPGSDRLVFGEQGGLTEILYAANGFLLVRKQVYLDIQHQLGLPVCNERFGRSIVPFFVPMMKCDGVGQWYMSEDFSFCERARQCGYRIWADTTIRLQHIGTYPYSWEDAGTLLPRYETFYFDFK